MGVFGFSYVDVSMLPNVEPAVAHYTIKTA